VTIELTVGDCDQGGHYGYAYLDASCTPMEIIAPDTIVCPGVPLTITAPPGGTNYLWFPNGETTQSINVTSGGNYSVDITAVSGCMITLDVDIYEGDTPTADFIADSVCFGGVTTFTDLTTGNSPPANWSWDFDGDGSFDSNVQNPTNTYGSPGTYAVTLEVSDLFGCTHDTTFNVLVDDQPIANFSSTSVCEGAVNDFTDLSQAFNNGSIASWEWDFDSNGSIDNTTQNPSHGYPSAGTYAATLTVATSGGCQNSITYPVYVNPMPAAGFTAMNVCDGTAVPFNNTTVISSGNVASWLWDFGDGSGTSANSNPVYTYSGPGLYNVQLTASTDSGCVDT